MGALALINLTRELVFTVNYDSPTLCGLKATLSKKPLPVQNGVKPYWKGKKYIIDLTLTTKLFTISKTKDSI